MGLKERTRTAKRAVDGLQAMVASNKAGTKKALMDLHAYVAQALMKMGVDVNKK
jgi:hypothetical protein